MWLLWVLPKNRPQPGSMFVSRENQIWPHFPGNHLQSPSPHTALDFLNVPPAAFSSCFSAFTPLSGLAWLVQIISLHFSFFQSLLISDSEITRKGRVMSCKINAGMNSTLKLFFSSFNTHSVILDWNLWDVCSSNLVSLIRHWFTSYVIQQLGRGSSPRLYLVWYTLAHNICQNMWPPRILFSFFPCLPLPHHHHHHLLPLHPFLYLGSWIRSTKATWKLSDRQKLFFFNQWDPTGRCLWM